MSRKKVNPLKHINTSIQKALQSRDLQKEVRDLVQKKLDWEVSRTADSIVRGVSTQLTREFIEREKVDLAERARSILESKVDDSKVGEVVDAMLEDYDMEDTIYGMVESALDHYVSDRVKRYIDEQFRSTEVDA